MEVPPTKADLRQLIRGKNGRMVEIDGDVQNVANRLAELDHHFRLRYSEAGEYYVVYWQPDEEEPGNGYLVTTARELDHRIVKTVERLRWRVLNDPSYSLANELELIEREAEAERDRARQEEMAEAHSRLGHALRKELGFKDRIVVP